MTWEDEGIRVEKARWGRHNIIKGKTKIELPKTVDASKLTLEEVKVLLDKNGSKKVSRSRKKRNKQWILVYLLQSLIALLESIKLSHFQSLGRKLKLHTAQSITRFRGCKYCNLWCS